MARQTRYVFSLEPERLIFTPVEQMYAQKLERITTWVSMGKDEKQWASKVGLVGLLDLKWKTPCNDWLVEFFNI
jgi:hypothetical protein